MPQGNESRALAHFPDGQLDKHSVRLDIAHNTGDDLALMKVVQRHAGMLVVHNGCLQGHDGQHVFLKAKSLFDGVIDVIRRKQKVGHSNKVS